MVQILQGDAQKKKKRTEYPGEEEGKKAAILALLPNNLMWGKKFSALVDYKSLTTGLGRVTRNPRFPRDIFSTHKPPTAARVLRPILL